MYSIIEEEMKKYAALLKEGEGADFNPIEHAIDNVLTPRVKPVGHRQPPKPTEEKHEHVEHNITSPYGERVHPVTKKKHYHSGVDLGAEEGTPVRSFGDGVVTKIGYDKRSGNYIIIYHEDEEITSSYSHLSKVMVHKGDTVSIGDQIGLVGSTGMVTGPHLHFRLKYRGQDIDPTPFIASRRIVE